MNGCSHVHLSDSPAALSWFLRFGVWVGSGNWFWFCFVVFLAARLRLLHVFRVDVFHSSVFQASHVHTAVAALGRAERALSSDVPRHAWSRLAAAATSNVDGECTGGVRCASLLRPFGQPVAQRASRHAESHVALRVSWPMQRQVCWDGQCVVAPHLRDSMLLPSR